MFDSDFWSEIKKTLYQRKWRSLMTAFGVFWGTFMLVILLGVGTGLSNGVVGSVSSIPSNSVFLIPGETSLPYRGFPRGRKCTMDNGDNNAIINYLKGKTVSVASVKFASEDPLPVNSGLMQYDFMVAGVTPSYYHAMPHKLVLGRYINDIDIQEERKVCVIGHNVAEQLFPDSDDVLDKSITINNVPYSVIGVCKNPNRYISIGLDPGESVLLPISTLQVAYGDPDRIDISAVILEDRFPASEYEKGIEQLVKSRHNIHPEDPTAIDVINLSQLLSQYDNLFTGLDILIWIVGLGTLLAGLIGISNIMMVTIIERTREFGIRQAIGARPEDIIRQVVYESLVLTLSAGIAALCTGVWALWLVNNMMETMEGAMFQNPFVPFMSAIACLFILIIGGVMAGGMPARRIVSMKTIDALRNE